MALSIKLTPGYTFATDGTDKVTYAKLNQLGSPIVSLSGTVGTSDIAGGSITNALLANAAVDSTKIADGAVGLEHLLTADQGTLLHRGSSGWELLAPGTAGKVLTTNGAGASASWDMVPTITAVGPSNIVAGANNTHLVTNGSGTVAWEESGNNGATAVVWEEQATGTNAGASDHTADETRVLNQSSDPAGVMAGALSGNQITLGSGSYYINATVPGHDTGNHVAWLYNFTDSSIEINGTRYYHGSSDTETGLSHIVGSFTISSTKVFEIRQRTQLTQSTGVAPQYGLGRAVNITGHPEIYTVVSITQIAS